MENNIQGEIKKIQYLIDLHKNDQALKAALNLLSTNIDNDVLLAEISRIYCALGDYDKSIEFVKKALQQDSEHAHYYYLLSIYLLNKSKLEQAEEEIKQAIRLEPESSLYFSVLSKIKVNQRKPKTALKYINKSIELDPENDDALDLKSEILLIQNKPKTSEKYINEALKVNPMNVDSHQRRARILYRKGDFKGAIEILEGALKIDPDDKYGRYLLQLSISEHFKKSYAIFRDNRKIINIALFVFFLVSMGKLKPAGINLFFPFILFQYYLLNSNDSMHAILSIHSKKYEFLITKEELSKGRLLFGIECISILILILNYFLGIHLLLTLVLFISSVPFYYYNFTIRLKSTKGILSILNLILALGALVSSFKENNISTPLCIWYSISNVIYLIYIRHFSSEN
jgi:tetratricopeptide (TPR) repeat protein